MEDQTIKIIDKPCLKFSGKEKEDLVDKLTELAIDGFGSQMTRDDVGNHALNSDLLYLVSIKDKLAGFAAYDILEVNRRNILYLSGMVFEKMHQKQNLFTSINRQIITAGNFDFIALRTQNPVVYAATKKIVSEIFPHQDYYKTNVLARRDVIEIASSIAFHHLKMSDFDQNKLVGRKTYGKCLYGAVPSHNGADDFFNKTLEIDYKAGDSVLVIGCLPNGRMEYHDDDYYGRLDGSCRGLF